MSVLAIDQGTTSTRALVLESSGKSALTETIEHRQIYPQANWVEHEPNELLRNIDRCIESSFAKYPDIVAIGIDNQGESCLAWHGDTRQAISPLIVWQDARTQAQIDTLKNAGLEDRVLELSGLPLDAYFSASKLAWIIENIPAAQDLLKQGKLRLGTTDAFFLDNLSGRFVTDITTASRTSLMDLASGQWSEELCRLFGVPIECLPTIVSTTGDLGSVSIQGRQIPITASVCDQQASLYGHDCRAPGDAKITFGTGAFALALTGEKPIHSPEQGLLPTIAWQLQSQPTHYALDGGVYSAGAAINWAKSLGLFESFEQINHFKQRSAIERGLVFVPALSGLACPYWDRKAAGLWIGLSLNTGPMDMMQSVLEGIAFRAAQVIRAMDALSPIGKRISIDGGVSANPYFCQFLANVLGKEISVQQLAELTAIGTARLAMGPGECPLLSEKASKIYQPEAGFGHQIEQFGRAIECSRAWF